MHRFVLGILAVLFVPALHAQTVEIYGLASGLYATNVPTYGGVLQLPPATTLTTLHNISPTGGLTCNVFHAGMFRVGVDARGSEHLALGGARAAASLPFFHVTPYLQGSLGYLNLLHNGIDNRYSVAEILVGVDVPLWHYVSARLVEVGVGHALSQNDGSKPTFITASSGLVFRF
jgi:hypothetical protein